MTSLSRTVTVLELSQSRKGFLRKQMNTVTQEKYTNLLEPEKKNFFGLSKNKNNSGQNRQGEI
jgi:hypothetical protein